jgi:hypothetical protein
VDQPSKRRFDVKRPTALLAIVFAIAVLGAMPTAGARPTPRNLKFPHRDVPPPVSGTVQFSEMDVGTLITECPQAGLASADREEPLDRRQIDEVEELSDKGDDVRTNTDYSCMPQNETSVAVNGKRESNLLTTQNDYRTRARQGFNSTTDSGRNWYSQELPPPSLPSAEILDASGDPVSVFDRAGVAYSSSINFNRTDDTNGIMVQRSTNGGYTWTRPCVPNPGPDTADPDEGAFCNESATAGGGNVGDPRQPGDNVVTFQQDQDDQVNDSVPFDDKEWMTAGPRPAGVDPVCFQPISRAPRACDPDVVGVDRLYVTWARFDLPAAGPISVNIMLSFSDDQGRSWSQPRVISGNAPFCAPSFPGGNSCDFNQFSVPTVHPRTGLLGVAFENFNTQNENQYLFVRSMDGGQTFEGPFFVTRVFDINYPLAGIDRPDCTMRGQQAFREVLTNTCFRVNAAGNVAVDKRGSSMTTGFGDDFYLIMSDNRNGTIESSNTDVFFFKSTNGGQTWIGPTRVNNDPSAVPANRNCGFTPTTPCPPNTHTGNDQWFPWLDVNTEGMLAAGFHDRRLDTDSPVGVGEWPASKTREGNYLGWFFGAGCRVTSTATVTGSTTTIPNAARQCLAPGAAVIPQPAGPQTPVPISPPPPGAGPAFLGPFANSVVSDVPHNLDYTFRAGTFMGDYNAVAFPNVPPGDRVDDNRAVGFWTDSRNGRGSGGPETLQPGRNPACEQADVFLDYFNPLSTSLSDRVSESEEDLFLVTPCSGAAIDDVDS